MDTTERKLIFEALKKVLKSKKLTYRDLAHKMHVAESTIKRMFSQQTCSLNQLLQICQCLGLTLNQLTRLYRSGDLAKVRIDQRAEDFFLNNKEYFMFLRQLSLYGSVKEVAKRNNLTRQSSEHYSQKLVQLGLLKPTKKGDYEMVETGFLQLSENSRLKEQLVREWSQYVLEQSHQNRSGFHQFVASTRLKKESLSEIRDELESFVLKMKERGYIENVTGANHVCPVGVSLVLAPEIINFPGQIPQKI